MATSADTPERRNSIPAMRHAITRRFNDPPPWVILTQLFIGLGWLRAATEKVIDPAWWRGEVITDFVETHSEQTLPWYDPFLDIAVLPAATSFTLIVVLAQLIAGTSLVTGRYLPIGLSVGIMLNLHFMAVGAVAPSAFYLLAQGSLALWLCEGPASAGRIRNLRTVSAVSAASVLVNLPFITTLRPNEVIDDPAAMFAFGGALTALTCLLAARSIDSTPEPQEAFDEATPQAPPRMLASID